MSKGSSVLRQAGLLSVANLAMRGVAMLFQVYLTGQVGAAGVGLLQLILTVNGFAITLGTSGIRVAAMYLSAEEYGLRRPDGVRRAMGWCLAAGLALSVLVGAGMAMGAELLAVRWVKDLRALAALRLLGLTLPVTCVSAILAGYFTACGQVRRLVAVEVADRIASVGLTMWLLGQGLPGDLSHACVAIVGGGALASCGSVAVLLWMMLRDFRRVPRSGEDLRMGRRLARFCVPVALNDYLRSGLGTLEQFLIPYGLARSGGSRTQALADYGTIQGMVFPVMMLPCTVLFAVADLLVPRLARCRAERDEGRTRRVAGRCLEASVIFGCAVAGLVFVLAGPLGWLLYGSSEAGRYLRLFAPLVPMLYLDCIVDGMHKGLGQQIYCVRVNTLTNLMDVIGLFFLLPRYGIGGYFFTYTVTHAVNFYLSIRRLMELTGIQPCIRFLMSAAVSVCGAVAVCGFIPLENRWSAVMLVGGIYLVVLTLLLELTGCRPIDKAAAEK